MSNPHVLPQELPSWPVNIPTGDVQIKFFNLVTIYNTIHKKGYNFMDEQLSIDWQRLYDIRQDPV